VLIDDLNLNEVFIIDPDKKDVIIQADSTNQDYTFGLTRVTHLEVQKLKKIQSQSDKQKIGSMSDLYYLYKLMHEIQTNLVRRKPRLKPLTLENFPSSYRGSKNNYSQKTRILLNNLFPQ
jgi:hypothetical protein